MDSGGRLIVKNSVPDFKKQISGSAGIVNTDVISQPTEDNQKGYTGMK